MKNNRKKHRTVSGKLLNLNKRWSDLSAKQKNYVADVINKEYMSFLTNECRSPSREDKNKMLKKVYQKMELREIWIPTKELGTEFAKQVARIERRLLKESTKLSGELQQMDTSKPRD